MPARAPFELEGLTVTIGKGTPGDRGGAPVLTVPMRAENLSDEPVLLVYELDCGGESQSHYVESTFSMLEEVPAGAFEAGEVIWDYPTVCSGSAEVLVGPMVSTGEPERVRVRIG